MKKNIFITLALCSAFVVSCKKEAFNDGSGKENGDGRGEYTYTIKGIIDDGGEEGKLGIGVDGSKYFGKWEEGDQVVIYEVASSSNLRKWITDDPIEVSNISEDGKSANIRFNTDFTGTTKCRVFYYTENLEGGEKGVGGYGRATLPFEQVQKGTGLENTSLKKYAFMYTSSDGSIDTKIATPATFYHALSYVNISFKSTDFAGWKVDRIVMKKDSDGTALAGGIYNINCSVPPTPTATRSSAMTARGSNVKKEISLTFENTVTLSSTLQNAWMVALPTYISNESDGYADNPVTQFHYVYFQLSKDGRREYAKVKFKTCLKGGTIKELKVGAIAKADIMNDYKEIYDEGFDIPIGDMVVNKTTFPTASVKTPDEINASQTSALSKGVVFIDDKNGSDITLTALNPSIANSGKLVVIGRYANIGKQVNINCRSLRNANDVAFLNVKFTCTGGESLFERNSTQATRDALRLVDCYIDAYTTSPGKNVIKDRGNNVTTGAIAAPFSRILVDNCVVKMGSAMPFYYLNKPLEGEPATSRTLEIKNSVLFYPIATADASVVNVNGSIADDELAINLTSNTIVNMVSGNVVRVYRVNDLVSDKDLVYARDMTTKPGNWDTPKYHWGVDTSKYIGNKVGTCSNCYFAWDDLWSTAQKWSPYAATASNNINKKDEGAPFTTAANYELGYFPVDNTKVTNGAGASYDTKKYFTWTTAE